MMSVFIAIPFLLYQIWAFVAPGLYKHEKRLVFPLLLSSTGLFYLGVAFAHFVVFPIVFAFFVSVAPEGVQVNTDITRYLDFAITLFFAFGIAFEVPVATVILVMVGITTPEQLVKARPYVFVGAFIVGMFLTPPDFISQTLLAIPMWLLYEVGIMFSRTLKVRVKEASAARDERDGLLSHESNESSGSGDYANAETKADSPTNAETDAETDAETETEGDAEAEADGQARESKANDVERLALDRKPDTKTGGYRNSLTDSPDDPEDGGP